MMLSKLLTTAIFSPLLLLPAIARAYTPGAPLSIDTGVHSSIEHLFEGLINVLLMWSVLVATGLFLLGVLMLVASMGSDEGAFSVSNAKKIIKAALIGIAIIAASWMILSTAVYFIAS